PFLRAERGKKHACLLRPDRFFGDRGGIPPKCEVDATEALFSTSLCLSPPPTRHPARRALPPTASFPFRPDGPPRSRSSGRSAGLPGGALPRDCSPTCARS